MLLTYMDKVSYYRCTELILNILYASTDTRAAHNHSRYFATISVSLRHTFHLQLKYAK